MFQLSVSCPLLSGYDEPETLSYQITLFGPIGADVRQSQNKLTYGLYSAGISDEQKREIIDQLRLPEGVSP